MPIIVSEFDGMIIDMEYDLCIPSVHARYKGENIWKEKLPLKE